jgi:uncharacterized protein (DUF427 family)
MAPAKQSPTITLLPAGAPVRIMFAGEELVNTDDALVLREGSLPPVLYIPKADVRWELTTATDRSTHCPYKGDAQYWSVSANGKTAENAIWSYPDPIESVSAMVFGRSAAHRPNILAKPSQSRATTTPVMKK